LQKVFVSRFTLRYKYNSDVVKFKLTIDEFRY